MSEKKRKVILTGDRPTGRLHIGHYVGSLRERVVLQNSGAFDDVLIMIADAQALTDNWDNPEKVRSNIMNVTLDYLSAGIDPKKSHILIQSQIPELPELTQYYMNLVTVQRLQRNPTVKAEIKLRGFSEREESQGTPIGFTVSTGRAVKTFSATVSGEITPYDGGTVSKYIQESGGSIHIVVSFDDGKEKHTIVDQDLNAGSFPFNVNQTFTGLEGNEGSVLIIINDQAGNEITSMFDVDKVRNVTYTAE